jgi:hypothetical protein
MKCLRVGAICMMAMLFSTVVHAGTVTQSFLVRGGGLGFDKIDISIPVAASLSSLGGGWTDTSSSANSLSAAGAAIQNLPFDMSFSDAVAPFTFVFQAYSGATKIEQTDVTWNGAGSGWSFTYGTGGTEAVAGRDVVEVPVPAAASTGLLLMGALGGMNCARKRRAA